MGPVTMAGKKLTNSAYRKRFFSGGYLPWYLSLIHILYMNFSGCCDLAIGSARILGYDLLENFESPFLAPTFRELWRRWHMSLTGWFRRYLYVPLGGSRKGLFRHCMNLLLRCV